MELLRTLLLIALLIYLAGGAALYFFQRNFIYFPSPYVSVPNLEEISLSKEGLSLRGYVARGREADQLLLYFGGNAEQVATSVADLSRQLPQITIVGFDYRGYGASEGRPREAALYRDALAQFDYFRDSYQRLSVMGRSLGASLATYVASERPVDALVLVTPFDSLESIAAEHYRIYPVRWLLRERHDSLARASRIEAPTLILTAAEDNIVPARHSRRLKEAFGERARLYSIPGTGHNTIGGSQLYGHYLQGFLQEPGAVQLPY